MAERKPSPAVMARILRNAQGATGQADLEARLRELRPLQPSAEYVAAANQALGRMTPSMAGEDLGGGYDILPQEAAPMAPTTPEAYEARLQSRLQRGPSAEAVALLNYAQGKPSMGPQVVAEGAHLPVAEALRPARPRGGAFDGAMASGSPSPQVLAALLRARR